MTNSAWRRSKYMRFSAVALIGAALVLVSCGGSDSERISQAADPDDLWGEEFVATSITRQGEPFELSKGTKLELLIGVLNPDSVVWRAGCNTSGGNLVISRTHLKIGAVAGTDIGCPPPLARQDRWLNAFFGADPSWRLNGDQLTLKGAGTVILLAER